MDDYKPSTDEQETGPVRFARFSATVEAVRKPIDAIEYLARRPHGRPGVQSRFIRSLKPVGVRSRLSRLAQKYTEPLALAIACTASSEGTSSFDNWSGLARWDGVSMNCSQNTQNCWTIRYSGSAGKSQLTPIKVCEPTEKAKVKRPVATRVTNCLESRMPSFDWPGRGPSL
jgi:hypothetical protein